MHLLKPNSCYIAWCKLQEAFVSMESQINQFIYLGSNILSTKSDINIHVGKAWIAIDWLMMKWKSDHSDKIKWEFFQAMLILFLHHSDINETLGQELQNAVACSFEQILDAAPCKQLYDYLPPISQTIQTRHGGYCWRSRNKLMSNVLFLWTPIHQHTNIGQLKKMIFISYVQTLDAF